MGVRSKLVDVGFKALNAFHRSLVRTSGARIGSRAQGLDMVELVTVGRRTGRQHSTMLLVPLVEGVRLVVVASKGGDQRDPDWLKNLVADPRVEVVTRSERRQMLAHVASPEERADLWPRVVAKYRSYENYQRRAQREIPLVLCSPREG